MLTSAQITRMRATANRALPDVCDIERHTSVTDNGGGYTQTWADVATGVRCRIAPLKGGERVDAGTTGNRISDETTHIVTLPAGTDVEETDRVVIGDATYEVTVVRERGAWELTKRAEVKESA